MDYSKFENIVTSDEEDEQPQLGHHCEECAGVARVQNYIEEPALALVLRLQALAPSPKPANAKSAMFMLMLQLLPLWRSYCAVRAACDLPGAHAGKCTASHPASV